MKVAHFLRQALDLSPQEALALAAQGDIVVAEGYPAHLRRVQAQLQALGATAEFRPGATAWRRQRDTRTFDTSTP